jgi:hypothetical protein
MGWQLLGQLIVIIVGGFINSRIEDRYKERERRKSGRRRKGRKANTKPKKRIGTKGTIWRVTI